MTKRHRNYPGTFEDIGDYRRWIVYVGGERHRFQMVTKDQKACEKFAREKYRELQLLHDRAKLGISATAFSALLSQYRRDDLPTRSPGTQRAYEDSLKLIAEYFVDQLEDPSIEEISSKHVRGFLAWRRNQRRGGKHRKPSAEPVSNRTLQKDRAVLHRLFDFAMQLELREGNPVSRVEQPRGDKRSAVILSDEQYEALLKACADRPQLWLYVLTLGETGGRCQSEVLHLRWEDIDLAEGFIEFQSGRDGHRTKNGKANYVRMSKRIEAALRDHFARTRLVTYHGAQTSWVFHHERDRRGCTAGQRVKTMRTAFDTAATVAGLPDAFHRHDLRHRRVTTLLQRGAPAALVREMMNHSDLRTTMGYNGMAKRDQRALDAFLNPSPAESSSSEKQA